MGYSMYVSGTFKTEPCLTVDQFIQIEQWNKGKDLPKELHRELPWHLNEDVKFEVPDEDRRAYDFRDWILYLISWLQGTGQSLTGRAEWAGEESGDLGWIESNTDHLVLSSDECAICGWDLGSECDQALNLDGKKNPRRAVITISNTFTHPRCALADTIHDLLPLIEEPERTMLESLVQLVTEKEDEAEVPNPDVS